MTEDEYRYERKFVLDAQSLADFRLALRLHPAIFRQAYPPRQVNNLYFDTRNRECYFDNVEGVADRTKMRVRWYGELLGHIAKPALEYKIKRGVVGTKRRFALPPFELEGPNVGATVSRALQTAELPTSIAAKLPHVEPTLLNRYHREYFVSANGFRMTIDCQLQSFDPSHATGLGTSLDVIVLELKYDRDLEFESRTMMEHFGLRVMKNSKYVTGLP